MGVRLQYAPLYGALIKAAQKAYARDRELCQYIRLRQILEHSR